MRVDVDEDRCCCSDRGCVDSGASNGSGADEDLSGPGESSWGEESSCGSEESPDDEDPMSIGNDSWCPEVDGVDGDVHRCTYPASMVCSALHVHPLGSRGKLIIETEETREREERQSQQRQGINCRGEGDRLQKRMESIAEKKGINRRREGNQLQERRESIAEDSDTAVWARATR